MIISLIAAMDLKGGIGKNNALPWQIRSDLQRFKKITMNHHIIMGRKTYDTIRKPLPGRKKIIVTRNQTFFAQGVFVVSSILQALSKALENGEDEVFIIGGGDIFSQTIDIANRIYLTIVQTDANADVFFPDVDFTIWEEISTEKIPASQFDEYDTIFKILERRN